MYAREVFLGVPVDGPDAVRCSARIHRKTMYAPPDRLPFLGGLQPRIPRTMIGLLLA
jgi:hypothetical protein